MPRSHDWNAPAKLFFWPAEDGAEEETLYPTLHAALRAAEEGELANAWIITQEGSILNPKMIHEMRLDMAPRRRERRGPLALFSRSRAL